MAMVMGEPPRTSGRSPRRWPWIVVALLLVGAVVTGAFIWGRSSGAPVSEPPPGGKTSQQPAPPPTDTIRWVHAPGGIVPVSPAHGPWRVAGALATGYSHEEMGAVMAAVNITTRLSSAAGAPTYEEVLNHQTVGERDTMRSQLSQEVSSSPTPPVPIRWWWQIPRGDPRGDLVEVVLYAETDQSQELNSFVRTSQILVWSGSDWLVQVPLTPPKLVPDVSGAVPLGW